MEKKKCVLRILDEVNCIFIGLSKDHIKIFVDAYAAYAKNYYFNPKFKIGAWDGKVKFFFNNGKTFVNLLDGIIPIVTRLGYNLQIDDQRSGFRIDPPHIDENFFKDRGVTHPITGEPWIVRDYQVDMVNTLLDHGSGVGIAGTGSGKTSMTAALALSYEEAADLRSIIIVPDKGLTLQTIEEYKNLSLDVGQYGAGVKDENHQHIVSTWQTLQNHPSFLHDFKMLVVDEAHGIRGAVLQELLNTHANNIVHRFGVTGTLPKHKADARAVYVNIGPTRCEIPAHQLQKDEYLADLHINVYQHKIGFEQEYKEYLRSVKSGKPVTYRRFCDEYFPDYQAEKSFLQTYKPRMEWIAHFLAAQHDLGNGNILCLVNGINVGKKLAKMVDGAIFLSGKDKVKVRKEVYDLFKERNDVTVIATIHIAGTGLDIPRIFQLVGIDVGKSFERTIQAIGRGLRKAHDKDKVIFSDITSDLKYSRKHLGERKKYYNEAQYRFKVHPVEIEEDDPQEDFFT